MRIGKVNQQQSFKRVVQIKINTHQLKKDDDFIRKDLINVLNNKKSTSYPIFVRSRMKSFFKDILGDYNGRRGILLKEHNNKFYLISGQEAENISSIEEDVQYCAVSNKKAQKLINEIIIENIENGEEGNSFETKPTSLIELDVNKNQKRIENIKYSSCEQNDDGDIKGKKNEFSVKKTFELYEELIS